MRGTDKPRSIEWSGSFARCFYETCKLYDFEGRVLIHINATELRLYNRYYSSVYYLEVIVTNKWGEPVRFHKLKEACKNEL